MHIYNVLPNNCNGNPRSYELSACTEMYILCLVALVLMIT